MTEQLGFDLFNRFERLTFQEAAPIYWELEGKFLRGHSQKSELDRFTAYFRTRWLDEFTDYDIKNYLQARKIDNPDLRGSSLNRERNRLARFFNAFSDWQKKGRVGRYDFSTLALPKVNPCEGIPKADETVYRRNVVVTPEDFQRWLSYAHPETRKIAILAVLTLLRRRDIQMLSKDAWNRALDVLSGTQSKTGKPYAVPVTMTVKFLLAKSQGEAVVDFTAHKYRWQRACRESGIWFQLRDLRRTGATHMLLEGIDVVTVQRYLGHTNIQMTMAYLNPPAKLTKEAAKKVEAKFVTRLEVPAYGFQEN